MLKLRLAPLAVIGLSAAIAFAQEPATKAVPKSEAAKVQKAASSEVSAAKRAPIRPARKPVVAATPVPVATPVPKKAGFWQRVFGGKKATPTPAPATPTPKPVGKKQTRTKPVVKPRAGATKPRVTTTDTDTIEKPRVEQKMPPENTEPPVKNDPIVKPPTVKNSKPKTGNDKVQNFPPSTDTTDADAVEKQKYDQAKAKAIADPKVQELRGKADLAASEDASRKALRDYNKAMFRRMKEIDPSIKDHVDRMESAVMSRLGE